MILGKRPRPPIKRTTSMTEFTLDLTPTTTKTTAAAAAVSNNPFNVNVNPPPDHGISTLDHRLLTTTTVTSPRNHHRRNSADHGGTPHFLTVCRLCNRRLISGRDIFMYRGDSAFCSYECRQEQMNEDEKKDKHTLIPKKPVCVDSKCSSSPSKVEQM